MNSPVSTEPRDEQLPAAPASTAKRAPTKAQPLGTRRELDALVTNLPRRIAYLSRVLYRTSGSNLPRGMRSVVFTLAAGPMRISDIAWQEGIGQPAATRMVARLEALGLVCRERGESDGRIVMAALTDRGREELDLLREQSRHLLREAFGQRSAAELRRLQAASDTLEQLIGWLLDEESRIDARGQQAQSDRGPSSRPSTRRALSS